MARTPVGSAAKTRWLVNRNFALLWVGQSLSVLGDFIFETTLVVWIAADLGRGHAWSSLAVSGLLAAGTLPVLLVGPVAGVLIDRWREPRRVMLGANALSALIVLGLLPGAGIVSLPGLGGAPPLGWRVAAIFAAVFLLAAVGQFFGPAATVLLGDIVPEPDRPRAAGLSQTSRSLATLIGPPLAAPLLFSFGPSWALLLNAASFLVALLTVRAIAAPRPAPEPVGLPEAGLWANFLAGLRFFRRSPVLVALAVSLGIAMLGFGALNALDVFFVTENLGVPAKNYGLLGAALGGGMLVGAVISGPVAGRVRLEPLVWGMLVVLGGLILVYARLTGFLPALVVIFLIGAVLPMFSVTVGPLVLRVTPREFVGRVSATLNPLLQAASILGMLLGGLLAGTVLRGFEAEAFGLRFGPLDTIFTGVGLLCLLAAAFARRALEGPGLPKAAGAHDEGIGVGR